jgi:predicted RNase H-like nuclease (RuvC/YqgF family)
MKHRRKEQKEVPNMTDPAKETETIKTEAELGIAEDQNEGGTARGSSSQSEALVPEKRVRDLQSTADRLRNQVKAQETAIQELQGNLTEAIDRYREALLKQRPEIPADLVKGSTVAELDSSLEQAQAVVDRVKQHLAEKVPAGAPQRSGIDISSMSPGEKITYGLRQRGIGK